MKTFSIGFVKILVPAFHI